MIFNIPVGGKRTVAVSVYGAANETITITPSGKTAFTVTTNSNGSAGTVKMAYGTYTLKGSVSGYSKTVTVNKNTTSIGVYPANTYFWHGRMPLSAWTSSGYTASNRENYGTTTVNSSITVNCNGALLIAIAGTAEPVDLTNISTIYFNVTTSYAVGCEIGVSSTKVVDAEAAKTSITAPGLASIDVSSLSGKYYLYMLVVTSTGSSNRTLVVDRVYGT